MVTERSTKSMKPFHGKTKAINGNSDMVTRDVLINWISQYISHQYVIFTVSVIGSNADTSADILFSGNVWQCQCLVNG